MSTTSPQRAAVIGAGFAGLATAALLAREGYDVTVIEKLETVGGRAGEETYEGFRFDMGPSWYLMPDAFDHFFALFDYRTEELLDLVPLDPAYRLFPEGQDPVDVPKDPAQTVQLFESIEPGSGKQLTEYLDSAQRTYDLALRHFLYTTFSSPKAFLTPEVRAGYGDLTRFLTTPLDRFVARRFRDTRLRQMLTYPAVFLSSHPSKTPALYHLMSHTDLAQGVRYPLGGFAAVVDAVYQLVREQGVRFRLGTEVSAITYSGSRATGVRVGSEQLLFDVVVSAADLHHTETHLLPPQKRTYDEPYFGKRDPGVSAVLVLCGVRGKLPQLDHHNLLFSRNWDTDFDAVFSGPIAERPLGASQSIYVSKPSTTDPSTAPEGDENLFVLVPAPASEALGTGDAYGTEASISVQRIAEAALDQLAEWCDIPDLRERIVVQKTVGPADFAARYHAWSGGAIGPAHTLRQSAFLRGRNASRKLENLYYAGATTVPGVGVPMCLISAENVLKRLRGDTSSGPLRTDF